MPERKYKNIKVSKQVNVSSTYHYHFKVMWSGGSRDYTLGIGFLTDNGSWEGAPKYLEQEVERQIADMFEDGSAIFYERDRDGNERITDLRYHDTEIIKDYIHSLRNPEPTFETRPRQIRFLVMLLIYSPLYILRKRHRDEARWNCYLINPKDIDEQGFTGVVMSDLKHSEVESAMHWLKVRSEGTNSAGELWQELIAKICSMSGRKDFDNHGSN